MQMNKLKFTLDLHDGLGTSQHQSWNLPFTHVTISPSTSSVWIHIALPPPLMTDSLASSASSPNTKPEPLQGQRCFSPNSGLSVSSCASDPLPMPHSRQRYAKYVVKSSKIHWNSRKRNLSAFYRILFILPLILTYPCGLQWNEMNKLKFTQICMMDLAHLSTNRVIFLSLMSPFHLRLALSGSILPYLPSWPISQHPHHAHQTPSLSPGSTNVVLQQIQVCQCRVVLQTLCQCLTADKDMQNTWWNHLRFIEIHAKEISTPSTAFFSYFRSYSHIHVVSNEMKWTSPISLRSAWWTWHISAPIV